MLNRFSTLFLCENQSPGASNAAAVICSLYFSGTISGEVASNHSVSAERHENS